MTALRNADLPDNLPEPVDDGACDHLPGRALPAMWLETSAGVPVNPAEFSGLTVIYIYPLSGADDSVLPPNWDAIPGARGCTPQACSFRNHHAEMKALDADVYGMATSSPAYLAGEAARIHLPYSLISDEDLRFQWALNLPMFDLWVDGRRLLKRVTLICRDARILKVFYPVFPPDRSAEQAIGWLKAHRAGAGA